MPSKKRKYNARFPAGRIKKIMQTDEEVGKVAQAVPIIISRTLELFVESLLTKAMRVTLARGAKTLSPSHVKQCILAESRFDFLRDLVQNIPDVTAAEEKEVMSSEDSPNTSSSIAAVRLPEAARRAARERPSDAGARPRGPRAPPGPPARSVSLDPDVHRPPPVSAFSDAVIDLSKKPRTANFYQETLPDEAPLSVITPNPTYATPQPSTSHYPVPPVPVRAHTHNTPVAPVTPILNIDFSKNLAKPEIKVLAATASAEIEPRLRRQNSKPERVEPATPDLGGSGNLQIDEDYDT